MRSGCRMTMVLAHCAPPECPHRPPRHEAQFSVARFGAEGVQSLEENLVRTAARIVPKFRLAGPDFGAFVQNVIARPEQCAIPLLRQRLPMQVVGGRRASRRRRSTGAMLMDNHAAQGLHAVGNPNRVSDGDLQFAFHGRSRVIHRSTYCPLRRGPEPRQRSAMAVIKNQPRLRVFIGLRCLVAQPALPAADRSAAFTPLQATPISNGLDQCNAVLAAVR